MKKLSALLLAGLLGCSHAPSYIEQCSCCRSCTTDYECEVQCEKIKGCDCAEYSALEELVDAYQADLRELKQSEDEVEELRR